MSEAVRDLASDLALIDGEAAALRDDGRSDFHAPVTKRGQQRPQAVQSRDTAGRRQRRVLPYFAGGVQA